MTSKEREIGRELTPKEKLAQELKREPAGSPFIQGIADRATQVVSYEAYRGKVMADLEEKIKYHTLKAAHCATIDETIRKRSFGPDSERYLMGHRRAEAFIYFYYPTAEKELPGALVSNPITARAAEMLLGDLKAINAQKSSNRKIA